MTSTDTLSDHPVTAADQTQTATARVLLYSDDVDTRGAIRMGVGRRPSRTSPVVDFVEVATHAAVIEHADAGGFDLFIFDGEAAKSGGLGLCRQLKNELHSCPPVLVVIGRPQDAWLASWSEADEVITHPVDPVELADVVARMLADSAA